MNRITDKDGGGNMLNGICRIPVIGCMVKGEDGEYRLDEDKSQWANIPADDIAQYLIERLGAGFWEKDRMLHST